MNRLFSTKSFIATAIALGAVVAGSAAHAGTNVTLVVGQTSSRYVQPAPLYVQPQVVQYGHERFERNERNERWERNDRRDSRFYDARATYRHARWGDFDHDGVPNQFDRAPYNPRRH